MMKKKILKTITAVCMATLISSTTAFAAPQTMPDGATFDPQFYANTYPDVAAAMGTDSSALYQHYKTYGQKEGRLPYDPATIANVNQPTIVSTKQYTPGMVLWAATPLIRMASSYGISNRVYTVQLRSDGIALITRSDDENFLDVCTPTTAPAGKQSEATADESYYVNTVASMGANSRIYQVSDVMLGVLQYGTGLSTLCVTEAYLIK